jgi:hypothetical protein
VTFLLLLAVAAGPTETPISFLRQVYAHYREPNFSPFKHPEHFFAPKLLGAIAEDSELAHGEVGYLDGDPICQCQDTSGMRPVINAVTQRGPNMASVRVSIAWPHDKTQHVRFSLVRTQSGWRIADTSSVGEPSLLAALEESNRKARAKH